MDKGKEVVMAALKKIPCAMAVITDGRWMECKECPRCRILHALFADDWVANVKLEIKSMPDNDGIEPAKL